LRQSVFEDQLTSDYSHKIQLEEIGPEEIVQIIKIKLGELGSERSDYDHYRITYPFILY